MNGGIAMLYSVQETADKLHISKVTVYKKLKSDKFKDKVTMKDEQTMVTEELLELLNDSCQFKVDLNAPDEATAEVVQAVEVQVDVDLVSAYKHHNSVLEGVIKEKDIQIEEYSQRLKEALEVTKNSQILLSDKPAKQDTLLMEAHFDDLDSKLLDLKKKMVERKEKKGFFSKLFNN
jgi:hypothetical protein